MIFPSSFLYLVSAIVYVFILFINIIKRKYNVLEHFVYLVVYIAVIFLIDKVMFPLDIDFSYYTERQRAWSYIPFKNLFDSIKFINDSIPEAQVYGREILGETMANYINAFGCSLVIGFCMPIINKNKSFKNSILKSIILVSSIEIIGVLINLITFDEMFNSEVILIIILASILGYLVYHLVFKKILRSIQ